MPDGDDNHNDKKMENTTTPNSDDQATTKPKECAALTSGYGTAASISDFAPSKSKQPDLKVATKPNVSETGKDSTSAMSDSDDEICKLAADTIDNCKLNSEDSMPAKVNYNTTPAKLSASVSSTFTDFMEKEFKDLSVSMVDLKMRVKELEDQHSVDREKLFTVLSTLVKVTDAYKELRRKKNRDDAEVQAQLEELRKCRSDVANCMRNSKTSQLSEVLKIVEGYISKQQSGEITKEFKDLLKTILASVKAEGKNLEKVESEVQTEEDEHGFESFLSKEYLWFRRTYREVNQQYMQGIEELLKTNDDEKLKRLLSQCQEKMKKFDESAERLLKSGLLKRAPTKAGSEREIGEVEKQIEQLKTEKLDLQKQLDGLKTQLDQQSQEKQQQAETFSAKESENQSMKTKIMYLECSIADKERIITEKENMIKEKDKMIEEKEKLINRQDNNYRKLESECDRMKQKLANAKKGKSDSDIVVAERDETIRTLQRDNDTLREQNEELRLQNEELLDTTRLLTEAGQMMDLISRVLHDSDVNDDEISLLVLATQ